MKIRLSKMYPGEKGTIIGYEKNSGMYRQKLMSMGLTKGTDITIINKAPLGDPVDLEVAGYHLSLRKEEADVLRIQQEGNE